MSRKAYAATDTTAFASCVEREHASDDIIKKNCLMTLHPAKELDGFNANNSTPIARNTTEHALWAGFLKTK